eukprot:CAMPEP_0170522042 /NCGR_PEP_ID=MMETSP0209-20121228/7493_1 /TAXON_ID=665100 ORGANISM="Litonotus pictus, Strain P1" /NCGR_SAMPLE_ID=MMETSP0209 /ASSEMBLY_ACC=CAM_ASM_000301 /LENGTH=448 /DNA_ID=CAMNT_0010809339 /DNA_START=63 /DNA_END=1409 /DNA_ORIENTATION=+
MGLYLKTPDYYKKTNSHTFKVKLLSKNAIITTDKDFYSQILGAKQANFTNSIIFKIVFGHFFPNSAIVVDGEQWQKIRKILTKAINSTSFDLVIPSIIRNVSYALKENSEGSCLANQHKSLDLINRILFDAFHCMVYDWDPETLKFNPESSELLDSCNIVGEAMGERFILPYPILWKIPTKNNKKFAKAGKTIRDFIEKFLIEQKDKFHSHKEEIMQKKKRTLLQELLIANELEDESKALTHDELVDQVGILFFGGYDTTSNVTSFCLNYLARNMDVQDHLRSLLIKAFPNGEEDILKSGIDSIEKITYLSHFVNEVHRVCPLAFAFRDCIKDTEINGYSIKKGETVMIDNKGIGQREDFWNGMKDLDIFRPERWTEHKPAPLEMAIPFGFGGRVCPGKRLATYEMKVFLSAALLKHKIVLRKPGEEFKLTAYIGMNVVGGDINYERI